LEDYRKLIKLEGCWLIMGNRRHVGVEKYFPRNISNKKMKIEVMGYLKKHPETDACDVAYALTLDPGRVIDMSNGLVRQGTLEYVADNRK
jgi:hypothetical protein